MDTHIVEKLAEMVADGLIDAEYLNVESEHSAMAACIGAQATGVRTFTATSSQGLALMWELLYVASGMRLPIVMAVSNRSLSAPLNIWGDWSDAIGARDSGWIQLYCETAQEAFDTVAQAYRIAEHKKVLLPVMVNIDGFFLSHVNEVADIPDSLDNFISDYKPNVELNPINPVSQGEYADPDYYQEFKQQQQIGMDNSRKVMASISNEFSKQFGRSYGNMEVHNPDAKNFIVTMGSIAGTIKHIFEKDNIRDVGLLKLKTFRPFPDEEIKKVLGSAENIGVLEKDISLGLGGALHNEIQSAMKKDISSFIGGLGGRDITVNNIRKIIEKIKSGEKSTVWIGSQLK